MSSFVTFQGDVTACVWNSTFRSILSSLEEAAISSPFAARILEDNPIAAPIGGLNLTSLTDKEIGEFIRFVSDLRSNSTLITQDWSITNHVNQFPIDLQELIDKASNALT